MKTVLVTGGSKGIGREVVKKLASARNKVFFTFRKNDDAVKGLLSWGKKNKYFVQGVASDAVDPDSYPVLFKNIQKETKSLDILVNNVGDVLRRSSFEESDEQLWNDAFQINVFSTLRATKIFLPLLKKSKSPVIVNVSSIAGRSSGAGDSLHYGVSKAAVDTLTVGWARELGKYGIRVVGVAPSAIDTDFQRKHSSPERLKKIIDQTPLGRIGTPEEVAEIIAFLCSERAAYISGDTVYITGGR
ncbi:MAG: SDR family oxidoreductase [Candidatus Omnitrophica bacterium]|nr:SDR family oxidoreductase [Candidatus Omnitrophota bacterium]